MSDYTPEQVEEYAKYLRTVNAAPELLEYVDAYATTLRQQGGRAGSEPIYQYRHRGAQRGFDDVSKEEFDQLSNLPTSETRIVYTHAERATVPDGWVPVPREPSKAMRRAYYHACSGPFANNWLVGQAYTAMLAAAPSQPVEVDRTDALEDEQWCETHGMHHSVEMRDPDCEFPDSQPAEGE